jgi:DNA-binding response OmpR family regulator
MSDAKKFKVLIVDDEADIVDMLQLRLDASGYQTIVARDGAEGYQKAKTEKPDILILDLMLPKMDGYKVCGLLKKDARYARVPIIMFTARTQETDKKIGLEVGADAYLAKPVDVAELLAKIKELLKIQEEENG